MALQHAQNRWLISFCFLLLRSLSGLAQFSAGSLVVLQAGDGSSALVNTGNPILLKEFSPAGTAGYSVAIPTASTALLVSGSASSEGGLSLSSNGAYLVFGGYAQGLPNTTILAGSPSTMINRGIGQVDAAGSYSLVAASSTFFSGNNIRSATSDGASNYWASGSNNGTVYFGLNTSPLAIQNTVTNSRYLAIFGGGLFFSSGSGAYGVFRCGSSLQVSPGQTVSQLINTAGTGSGTPSPYGFYFDPAQSICYVADDRNPVSGGGIQKWTLTGGVWSLAYTLGTGAAYGARGVVADFSGASPLVYATTAEGASNRLIVIKDVGSASTATTLASSGTNANFRGLSFSPSCSVPQIQGISANSLVCSGQSATLSALVSGSALNFSWLGPNGFSAATASPVISAAPGGNYSLTLSNGCGTVSSLYTLSTTPLPVITINTPTICNGGSAVLTASGAATYSWVNGSPGAGSAFSPTSTTEYTLVASSPGGCTVLATASIVVVTSLALSAGSTSVCEGAAVSLTVSGADTYSWSNGDSGSSITVSPIATGIYTVVGNASGCLASPGTTVLVQLIPLPVLSVSSASICAGTRATLTASGAVTYSWNIALSTPVVNVYPGVTTSYTVTGSAQGCSSSAVATVTVELCTGLNASVAALGWVFYPNPAGEMLYISLPGQELYTVEILDAEGKSRHCLLPAQGSLSLDVSQYAPGIYFIKMTGPDGPVMRKFIKE